jgi:hypothetical protein
MTRKLNVPDLNSKAPSPRLQELASKNKWDGVNLSFVRKMKKRRVPDTFQLTAILPFLSFFPFLRISNLRVFNGSESPDSPRLHHFNC